MLFPTRWDFIDTGEQAQKRLLAVFRAWTPPDAFGCDSRPCRSWRSREAAGIAQEGIAVRDSVS